MNGCSNCKYCKCYPGDHWTPDDYECVCGDKAFEGMSQDEIDAIYDTVWEDGKQWSPFEESLCPAWEEVYYPPYEN